jgi:ABC-type antimicrobial peptide transport system permease subunit
VTYEIVGVVRDAKYQDLRDPILKTMYIAWTQRQGEQPSSYSYLVRLHTSNPMIIVPGLERVVAEADPALRVRAATPYETIVEQGIATERTMAILGGLFGTLALIVAAIGTFGLLAFQVTRRTNELAVRVALGASGRSMMRLVLKDLVLMIVPGIAIGCVVALMLTGLARKLLFGVTPTDPGVFLVSATVLVAAVLLAGWLPAFRASRVDSLVALRHE